MQALDALQFKDVKKHLKVDHWYKAELVNKLLCNEKNVLGPEVYFAESIGVLYHFLFVNDGWEDGYQKEV